MGAIGAAVARALGPIVDRGLGFDLRAAVRARHVRLVALHTVDGQSLPSDWAIPIRHDEAVVACAPLGPPLSGVAALLVQACALPGPKFDDIARERIARALAEALLAELDEQHEVESASAQAEIKCQVLGLVHVRVRIEPWLDGRFP